MNIYENNVVYKRIIDKDRKTIAGGRNVNFPVRVAKHLGSGNFTNSTDMITTATESVNTLGFDWKGIYATQTIYLADEAKNSGKEQVVNYAKEVAESAMAGYEDYFATQIFNAGSSAGDIAGLRRAFDTTNSYGAVDKATNSWLQGNKDTTTSTVTIPVIVGAISDCKKNNGMPTAGFCTFDVLDNIEALLQPQERYVNKDDVSAGFNNIAIKQIPIYADSHCPDNHLFLVPEKQLHLVLNKNMNKKLGGWVQHISQAVKVQKVLTLAVLAVTKPKAGYMFTGLSS